MRYFFALLFVVILATALFSGLPGSPGEILSRGKALEKANKIDEVIKLYSSARLALPPSDRSPGVEEIYRSLGALLGKLNQYNESEKVLVEGLGKFPESTALLNLRGLLKFRMGLQREAEEIWKKVLKISPNNAFAGKWLSKAKTTSVLPEDLDLLIKLPGQEPIAKTGSATPLKSDSTQPPKQVAPSKLSTADQEKLGQQLYLEMSHLNKWELQSFVALHEQVIAQCQDTDWAQESCWRLSNLHLLGFDEPDYQGIIKTLEHLLKVYPDSQLVPDARGRLLIAYQKTGQNDKVVEFYEELFRLNPSPNERQFMLWSLEYADALLAMGRSNEARELYKRIVKQDNQRDQLEARVARDRLAKL